LLLKEGGTGLSVAADLPTQIGYDSDDPEVEEEVGRVGVALDSLVDAEILLRDIPLDNEWAYARPYRSEAARTRALDAWLHIYNHHRHLTAVGGPPISRLNNLVGQNT
jgi:methylmalonyl-CoA mutase N-terminal domain/subunit